MATEIVHGRSRLPARAQGTDARPTAVAIGNFDGVHRAHRILVEEARRRAAVHGAQAGVLTFDPHPAKLFAPSLAPPLIMPLARRVELLGEIGADFVVVEPFTAAFAAIDAERFVTEVLAGDFGAREVVVGYDFTFGRGREGDARRLAELGAATHMGVTVVPPVVVDGVTCHSTKIREFILEGRVEGAELLLGRPFEVTGQVVRGAGRGQALGIPTANLRPEGDLLPRGGVYVGRAVLLDERGKPAAAARAAINVGTNPTFDAGGTGVTTVEAHLLDFQGDLYGRRLRLELRRRLRDERRFSSPESLVAQIRDDIARARTLDP